MEFNVHKIDWTEEKVKNFWNFHNNYPAFENLWFSKQVGREIISFTRKFVEIKGAVLDYGIGKGHLTGYLMESDNIELYGCDFSDDTVVNVNRQFQSQSGFKGCSLVKGFPSSFREGQFDIVFLIEAIEHLTDDYLLPTIEEIRRVLKPGGSVIVTTPNDEDLDLQDVICPDCGCVFHRVQHVRSFNTDSLGGLMQSFQFEKTFCGAVNFGDYKGKVLLKKIRNALRPLIGSDYKAPHLVYIGKKAQ
ncbi:MAG TPA: class I SAM-dependent methyltransferase [Puia sp.]|nr:class I SAM-dependent methyltransferase [Puia sp.]